ncbi:S-layer homology domain-containing protein [Collinsella sp. An2]|uniref:S-layer homology domain-containing protein n=1 Tax=Collinsella sp. An2 TaxID=1965585 RepID=UPI00117C7678|nr:S-layer homology domain-containing protein [Collinsella sp. An2]
MTACVKNHSKRVALAISASLVGALTLGAAAPAVAFAEDGAATQSVPATNAFENGTVTYAKDNNGYIIKDPEGYEFEHDGQAHHILPLTVLPDGAARPVTIDPERVHYEVKSGNWWRPIAKEDMTAIGEYRAVVKGDDIVGADKGQYDQWGDEVLYLNFSIVAKSLQGATIFNGATGDISNSTFTYTGEDFHFGFVIDGLRYDYFGGGWNHDTAWNPYGEPNITVEWYITGTNTKLPRAPKEAGSYTAVLHGQGEDYKGSETHVNFTIGQLDLSTADVFVADQDVYWIKAGLSLPKRACVNGVWMDDVAISWGAQDPGIIHDKGVYTMKVDPAAGNDNLTGTATVSFKVADSILDSSDFSYDCAPLRDLEVIYDDTDTYFDYKKIACADRKADFQVTVTDADGNVVSDPLSINHTPGTYTVTISFADDNLSFGLKEPVSFEVKVLKDELWTGAELTYTWDGAVVSGGVSDTYTGENLLAKLGTKVTCDGKTLVAGTDYQVVVTDINGQVVDQAVETGTYFINVVSDTYKIVSKGDPTGTRLVLHVQPLQLPNLYVGSDDAKTFGDKNFIPYTGGDHGFYFYYMVDGKQIRLPEGVIEVDHFNYVSDLDVDLSGIDTGSDWETVDWEDVDTINAVGHYVPSVKIADDNYLYIPDVTTDDEWGGEVTWIDVRDANVFTDVPSTHWGAEEIYQAKDLGYMSGYQGTTFFGPADHLSRAQAAVVLYNMGTNRSVDETNDGWNTWHEHGLAFPDAEQWYAVELGWASTLDIVKGYPDGNYGGSDEVSREQFAIMLRNYAAAKGEDVSVDDVDAALEGVKDADTISDWAREAVAWAVENGVMGAEGYVYADQPIERAQAAIMTTRFQPKRLTGSDLLINVR